MEEQTILYTTHCPMCLTLEKRLKQNNIQYTENTDIDEMISLGFKTVPVLKVGSEYLDFHKAIRWVHDYNNDKEGNK